MLGLPLAFILSQDQTLHCKKFNLFPGIDRYLFSYLKFIAALFQRTSFFHFTRFNLCRTGRQTYNLFSFPQHLFNIFFKYFFSATLLVKGFPSDSKNVCLFESGCKSTSFFYIHKFLCIFFFDYFFDYYIKHYQLALNISKEF